MFVQCCNTNLSFQPLFFLFLQNCVYSIVFTCFYYIFEFECLSPSPPLQQYPGALCRCFLPPPFHPLGTGLSVWYQLSSGEVIIRDVPGFGSPRVLGLRHYLLHSVSGSQVESSVHRLNSPERVIRFPSSSEVSLELCVKKNLVLKIYVNEKRFLYLMEDCTFNFLEVIFLFLFV